MSVWLVLLVLFALLVLATFFLVALPLLQGKYLEHELGFPLLLVVSLPLLLWKAVMENVLRVVGVGGPDLASLTMNDMRGKVVIVTGCNTGVGKQAALYLSSMGATVVMACRSHDRAHAARNELDHLRTLQRRKSLFSSEGSLVVELVDIGDFASVRDFATRVTARFPDGVDVVVCNAGLNTQGESSEGLSRTYQTNYLGHVALVLLLLPSMRARAASKGECTRVVTLGSVMHHWGHPSVAHGCKAKGSAYADSKLALTIFAHELHRREAERSNGSPGVVATCVNPGAVRTDIWRFLPSPIRTCFDFLIMRPMFLSAKHGSLTMVVAASCPSVRHRYLVPYSLWCGVLLPFELGGMLAGAVGARAHLPSNPATMVQFYDDSVRAVEDVSDIRFVDSVR